MRTFKLLCFARAHRKNGIVSVRDSKMAQLVGSGKPMVGQADRASNKGGGGPKLKGGTYSLVQGVSGLNLKPSSSLHVLVLNYLRVQNADGR